jgi:hypothetical protein
VIGDADADDTAADDHDFTSAGDSHVSNFLTGIPTDEHEGVRVKRLDY